MVFEDRGENPDMSEEGLDLFFREMDVFSKPSIGFHIPGHVGMRAFTHQDCINLISMDTTELSSSDDLHDPQGAVRRAADYAAGLFGSGTSVFICSGSTTGIQVMLSSVLTEASHLLMPRAVHMSVPGALSFLDCSYSFVSVLPAGAAEASPIGVLSPEILESALSRNPHITDVLITSPDYYGQCADIASLSEIAHRHMCRLLVDEAHGAHFAFGGESFAPTAMQAGADISVQSLHKTLPALTMASILHISRTAMQTGRVSSDRVMKMLRLFETSSPSFVIAASAERAMRYMEHIGKAAMETTAAEVMILSERISRLSGLRSYPSSNTSHRDPFRLVIKTNDGKWYAPDIMHALEKKGIFIEMADPVSLVLPMTVFHGKTDYDALFDSLKIITDDPTGHGIRRPDDLNEIDRHLRQLYAGSAHRQMSIRNAYWNNPASESCDLLGAAGRTCADLVMISPPGIPLLWPGEIIEKNIIAFLLDISSHKMHVSGISDKMIQVLKE